MKASLDRFSKQSSTYKKFRPSYPVELYNFLFEYCTDFDRAWDCATSNGQVAIHLASVFKLVQATDISEKQIGNSEQNENVQYSICRAEQTPFEDSSFDLITVGQAIHWFDIPLFFEESKRVLKSSGILAFWGYGLLRVNPKINEIIDHFYTEVVGPYWDFERNHVDSQYSTIEFDFQEIETPKNLKITTSWTLEQFEGYFNSWSAVQNYKEKHESNPVDEFIKQVKEVWSKETMEVNFPIFLRLGKNPKKA